MSHNEVGKYGTKSPLFEEKRGDFFEFEYLGGRKIFRIVVMGQPLRITARTFLLRQANPVLVFRC